MSANNPSPLPRRRKPLGRIQPLTPEQIVALAEVTPQDLEEIKAGLDPELAALLDAEPEEPAGRSP